MNEWKQAADETHRAIGHFMSEFSQAEYAIRYHLALEIGLDDQYFDAVVGSYDVSLLCTVATEVFAKRPNTENADAIGKHLKMFRSINDKRNRIAHGLWVAFKDGGMVHHVTRSKLTSQKYTDQAIVLDKLANNTSELRAQLERAFMGR